MRLDPSLSIYLITYLPSVPECLLLRKVPPTGQMSTITLILPYLTTPLSPYAARK